MARRRSIEDTARPSGWVAAVTLGGWGVRLTERDKADSAGWVALGMDDRVAGDVWREHEAFLRTEAKRRGIKPTYGPRGDQFYGEFIADGSVTDGHE